MKRNNDFLTARLKKSNIGSAFGIVPMVGVLEFQIHPLTGAVFGLNHSP